ncbi:MAG: hypothetical protein JEZ08_21575 [Clostridiales bacterium]|nr:hypothetical protein [Clostridiales bacterium]
MKYLILSEDLDYIEALESYYKKHYKSEIDILFNDFDVVGYNIICTKEYAATYDIECCLSFSNKNQIISKEINQYQSGRNFMNFLLSIRNEDFSDTNVFRTFGFMNAVSTAGTTTLSLNLAKALSHKGKTIWFSLEQPPSTMYYLDQKSGISMLDILFYLKQDMSILEDRILKWVTDKQHFYFFDQTEVYEELDQLDINLLNKLLDILKQSGFSSIVIDFGRMEKLFKDARLGKKVMLIKQDLNHYYRLSTVLQSYKSNETIDFLINQRLTNIYLNEAYLRMISQFSYIDFDESLNQGDRKWISEMIQGQLMKHLKL